MIDFQSKGRYIAFLAFTFTLCFILLFTTALLIINKLAIADYKEIIIVLGIPTIVGMAFNSFFHTNPKPEDVPDDKKDSPVLQKPVVQPGAPQV